MNLRSPVETPVITSPDCGIFAAPRPNCRQVRNGAAEAKYPHRGVDLRAQTGTPVMAAAGGAVTFVGYDIPGPAHTSATGEEATAHAYDGPGGLMVFIDHGDGVETRYMHLSAFSVNEGDAVSPGDAIGLSGDSGDAKGGPHLHFEVIQTGDHVDPWPMIRRSEPTSPGGMPGPGSAIAVVAAAAFAYSVLS